MNRFNLPLLSEDPSAGTTNIQFGYSPASAQLPILVGSSRYCAIADDALKDEDNAGWVMSLRPTEQQDWIERIRWIRMADRLAESDWMLGGQATFQAFFADWQHLCATGEVVTVADYGAILRTMRDRWFQGPSSAISIAMIRAWHNYLLALQQYQTTDYLVATCAEYEAMLMHLAGSFFQILPALPTHHLEHARAFGMVDQFYNHLRDLQEDTAQRVCYFPRAVLDRFGVKPEELFSQQAPHHPRYIEMMRFWLDDYLPRLQQNAQPLCLAGDLPLCWQILTAWSMHRYRRIEAVFRACQFDYTEFPKLYWQRVQAELPTLLQQVRAWVMQEPVPLTLDPGHFAIRGWQQVTVLAGDKPECMALSAAD